MLVGTDKGADVKKYWVAILGLVFTSGCVSTVSEPSTLKTVVSNAETTPQAVDTARRQAAVQREAFNQTRRVGEQVSAPLRQPSSVEHRRLSDDLVSNEVLGMGTSSDVTYSDLAPSVGSDSRSDGTGLPLNPGGQIGGSQVQIDTKGLPVLSGIRCLGIVSTKTGRARYMLKQENQAAAVAASESVLRVEGRGYLIRGSGADGVVVEDGQGQSFLIRR